MAWAIDPAHSSIQFSVRHMMITNVRGEFEQFDGTIDVDEQHPEASKIDIRIEAGSINTHEPKRNGHLKSPDFLDAEKYPALSFKSKRVERIDESHARLVGDLTIRDVRREVAIEVEYVGQMKSPWGTTSAGFNAQAKISRKDWGLNWNQALEAGGWLVGDQITINIDLELVKQEVAAVA